MERRNNHKQIHFYAEVTGSEYISNTTYPPFEDERYIAFKDQQKAQFELFTIKDKKYGRSNILEVDKLPNDELISESLNGIYFRMRDKLNRFRNLIHDNTDDNGETIEDTLNDLSNYANIALMVHNKKW